MRWPGPCILPDTKGFTVSVNKAFVGFTECVFNRKPGNKSYIQKKDSATQYKKSPSPNTDCKRFTYKGKIAYIPTKSESLHPGTTGADFLSFFFCYYGILKKTHFLMEINEWKKCTVIFVIVKRRGKRGMTKKELL